MPTYAYVCTECGHTFEAVQAITDDSLTVCPSCGGVLRKKFHPVGVTFKGSGFYRTDSRSGSTPDGGKDGTKKKEPAASGSKESGSSSSGGGSSDSSGSSSSDGSSSSSPSSGSSSGSGSGSSGSSSKVNTSSS